MTEPMDEDYLYDWCREQQLEAWRKQHSDSERCPACAHPVHGVVCSFTGIFTNCQCPSSFWGEEAS